MVVFAWPAAVLAFVSVVFVMYFKYYAFRYWAKRQIPYAKPSIPTGNVARALIGKQSIGDITKDIYNEFKRKGCQHVGIYVINSPVYVPIDPDIIKNILVRDFQDFVNRGVFYDEINEPLTAHLFSLEGVKWRNLRSKLTPTFTSGKMKMMFNTVLSCTDNLITICDEAAQNGICLDIKDILARFTTDVIGSCAFGLECNSLTVPDAEFRKMGRRLVELSWWEAAKTFIAVGFPSLARLLHLKIFDASASHFFTEAIRQTILYREMNDKQRNDFLQLLIQLKNQGCLDYDNNDSASTGATKLTFNEVAAQAFLFFIAGFETSATTMTFALFELACNSHIQSKLKEEIENVLEEHDAKLTYDCLAKMKYMDKVIQETLRKYPPVLILNRQSTTDNYNVPNTNLVLEKGTNVFIPVYGLHWDPQFYPEPHIFDPSRFDEENKANRHPGVYLPFGDGPRICIGLRFGMMQIKVGLAELLRRYVISLSDKTKLPLKFFPKSFILTTENGIWLNVKEHDFKN